MFILFKRFLIICLVCYPVFLFAQFSGGNGKGDAMVSKNGVFVLNFWEISQNNRVITRRAFNQAIEIGVFTANALTDDLRTINANTISASTYSPTMSGINAAYAAKNTAPRTQLLIKGDFRSIRIDPSTGQPQCSTRPSYSQLLWLDNDNIIVGVTKCFTDKTLTLTSAYNPPSTTDWFNIQNGKAIQINSSGVITALCN